jgi:hypothetical protein
MRDLQRKCLPLVFTFVIAITGCSLKGHLTPIFLGTYEDGAGDSITLSKTDIVFNRMNKCRYDWYSEKNSSIVQIVADCGAGPKHLLYIESRKHMVLSSPNPVGEATEYRHTIDGFGRPDY